MIEYPKIETLYDRDEKTFKVIPGKLRMPEFAIVKNWHITEKVDGTNIRIGYNFSERSVEFGGRTDAAQIPATLISVLREAFSVDKFSVFNDNVVLFGEGYGNKIQKVGSLYREDVSFILFDAKIGNWWLEPEKVSDIASLLGIECVPAFNAIQELPGTADELQDIVGSLSTVAQMNSGLCLVPEGIVARSYPMLFSRNGKRIMWKLKFRDF